MTIMTYFIAEFNGDKDTRHSLINLVVQRITNNIKINKNNMKKYENQKCTFCNAIIQICFAIYAAPNGSSC